jgi:ABC-transporter N-terminal
MSSVQLEFPKIEVRFKGLKVDAYVHVGSRALPTIPNFIFNMAEVFSLTPIFLSLCRLALMFSKILMEKFCFFQGFFKAFENIPGRKNKTTNFG